MCKCLECDKSFKNMAGLAGHLTHGCPSKSIKIFIRKCPECNCETHYKSKNGLKNAIKNNILCKSCRKESFEVSDEVKKKISETLKMKYKSGELTANMSGAHSKESRSKQSESKRGTKLTKAHKENIKKGLLKSEKFQNSLKCTERSKRISKALKGRKLSEEHKLKLSENHCDVSGVNNPFYGKTHSPETKQKLRMFKLERILNSKNNGFQLVPFYNTKACIYFNKLMEETETHITHAENGGELHIKELGYWVDGYDEVNNIVYEWDENHHFKSNGEYIEKDIIRQKEIEQLLGCKFIRIKESDMI